MFLQKQVSQFARWMSGNGSSELPALCAVGAPLSRAMERTNSSNRAAGNPRKAVVERPVRQKRARRYDTRTCLLEAMEPRFMMAADPIQIGAVYVEEDLGSDLHGDLFYVTFNGGAAGTQLRQLTINGDLNEPGFGLGDLFFDTVEDSNSFGADHAYPFKIERLETANPNASVTATVEDGTSLLVLNFTNFFAGDRLVFSIDVDEVQSFDPNEPDISVLNDNFDPITSGVEFQHSLLQAEFVAPHYEDVSGQDTFVNRYDPIVDPTGLDLPKDNEDDKRDRTAGAAFQLQQKPKPVSLSGIVYQDRNEDLAIQTSDRRLSDVRVELFRLDGDNYVSTGHTTTTDSQGRYEFGTNLGLQPGTYQVRQSQPRGYYSVGATAGFLASGASVGSTVANNPDVLTSVELPLGDLHARELNFAENLPSSISGHVCVVITGFDCFSESSEKSPLEGVLIELRDASGAVVATRMTDANGFYEFDMLRSGTYSLTEITPAGLLEGSSRVGSAGGNVADGSRLTQIVLAGDTTATDYDFCEITPSDLSGYTFFDQNNNGRRDTGEMPLADVLVTLWDDAGNRVAETRTNSQGFYQFTQLRPGTYRLTEQTPAGYIPGRADVGSIAGRRVGNSDATGDVITAIVMPAGSRGVNYDFGEILAGSISGRVISDTNGNCILDAAGDQPLSGVTIELLDATGIVVRTTITGADGRYEFENLMPGQYSVRETQPAGYFQGDQSAGSGGGDDSVTDLISSISVLPGAVLVDYDFCEIPPASIAGLVYSDLDQDCNFDVGEQPIAGVTVTLVDRSGNVVATTQTGADGRYEFTGLRPGEYSVRETQPAGFLQGGQRAGSGGGDDSRQDVISAINIGAGATLVNYDFCEVPPSSISGVVYADMDQDCVFDADEDPISGVTIALLDASGNVVATTQTDSNGRYQFSNLAPGQYAVRETQPLGFFQGGQRAGSAGGDDSQQDIISAINIGAGATLVNYDFCELLPGSIAGVVFADLDFDRMQGPNEISLGNVQVELLDAQGTVIATTRTLADGSYHFTNLRPAEYSVRETTPDGYFQGGQVAPATGGIDSTPDLISRILVGSGQDIVEANFYEVPPAEITGYVFQDGPVIQNSTGQVPEDRREVRDGLRTEDDTPLAGVMLELRLLTGAPAPSGIALPGTYTGATIRVQTDENGFYRFSGLRAGSYHVFQVQPVDYIDSLDTPGSTGGLTLNSQAEIETFFNAFPNVGLSQFSDEQLMDAVLSLSINPGEVSLENNFSEVLAETVLPPPPPPPPPPIVERPDVVPPLYSRLPGLTNDVLSWTPAPLVIGFGYTAPPTWHLSVINGGFPRGNRDVTEVDEETIARNAERLDVYNWTVKGMARDQAWRSISTETGEEVRERRMFDLPRATPLAGDFNGDGYDEIALFLDGEWFIDLNNDGAWDEGDIWMRLGNKGDQPVVGDWDGDGKADVGVYGERWDGDERAIEAEPGLPDAANRTVGRFKNVPPSRDEAPDDPRLMKGGRGEAARADLIDHVFRFGAGNDIAIAGDFNGDKIATVGVFKEGLWRLDENGDGRFDNEDSEFQFGRPGDLPLVGNFDGDPEGIEEFAVVRGNLVIVDSNGNRRLDATDKVFELESTNGSVVAGDFNGDGTDEPILHQSAEQQRSLQARLAN